MRLLIPRAPATTGSSLLGAVLVLGAGCAARPAPSDASAQRQQLLRVLEHEMNSNTGWVRIHAADALIDHGCTQAVASSFASEADTAAAPYRIGVWRVLARAAASQEQQQAFTGRIHRAMLDPQSPDRVHAAESLAKLGAANPSDHQVLVEWLATASEAESVYPLWLLVLSGSNFGQTSSEARLVQLLDSEDSTARLRAAFALGRIKAISTVSIARLNHRLEVEPAGSPVRSYVAAALLRHTASTSASAAKLKQEVARCFVGGGPTEQLECAIALGLCGTGADLPLLARLMRSPQADARIGAASGSLYVMRRCPSTP